MLEPFDWLLIFSELMAERKQQSGHAVKNDATSKSYVMKDFWGRWNPTNASDCV